MSIIDDFTGFGISRAELFDDPDRAVDRISEHYQRAVSCLRDCFYRYLKGQPPEGLEEVRYPFVGVRLEPRELNLDGRLSYGVLHEPGLYGATLTRPSLFADYYRTQLGILMSNHKVPLVVGVSERPIPLLTS